MRERDEEDCQPNSGDPTTMTIEFLRARLLSERSVSKTAWQRADQLAKRVVELEEQFRTATIQRKKAEKAAAGVLAILDFQGIGDSSGVVDSCSGEEDVSDGPREDEIALNEETNSVGSRAERSEVEIRLSGSVLDVSPNQVRSLSWKRNGDNSDSSRKEKLKQIRQGHMRHGLFSTVESPSRHLMGKSCRKIKRRYTGSAVEDEIHRSDLDIHGHVGTSFSGCSDDRFNMPRGSLGCDALQACQNDESEEAVVGLYDNTSDRDEEIKRVLEDQAQLIDQYQEEENAQKEWEEKYNEKESSSMGVPGLVYKHAPMHKSTLQEEDTVGHSRNNYSDNSSNESWSLINNPAVPSPKCCAVPVVPIDLHDTQGCSSNKETAGSSGTLFSTDINRSGNGHGENHGINNVIAQELDTSDKVANASSHEVLFPFGENFVVRNDAKHGSKLLCETSDSSHGNGSLAQPMGRLIESSLMDSPSSNSNGTVPRWRLSEAPTNSVGGVLKALQSAKMSLQQQLGSPSSSDGTLAIRRSLDPRLHHVDYDKMLESPINSSGLFQLPTHSFVQSSSPAHLLDPSGLRLGATNSAGPRYSNNDLRDDNHNKYPAEVSASKPYLDPYMASGIALRRPGAYFLPESSMARARNFLQDGYGSSHMDVGQDISAGRQDYFYGPHSAWPDPRRL